MTTTDPFLNSMRPEEKLRICFVNCVDNPFQQYELLQVVTFNTMLNTPLGQTCRNLIHLLHEEILHHSGKVNIVLLQECAKLDGIHEATLAGPQPGHHDPNVILQRNNDDKLGAFLDNLLGNTIDVDCAIIAAKLDIDTSPF